VSNQVVTVNTLRNEWGLPFTNYLLSGADVNADAAVRLFGHDQVYDSSPLGDYEDPEAAIWVQYAKNTLVNNGVCFGLVAFSQHAPKTGIDWLPGNWVPFGINGPYALIGPGGPSPQLDIEIARFHLDQLSAQFLDYQDAMLGDENASPTRAVDAVRNWGQNGGPPVLIVMQTASGGHAVLAYNLENDGSGGWYIDVYDPNEPYSPAEETDTTGNTHKNVVNSSRVHINPDGSWTFSPLGWSGDAQHIFPAPWGAVPDPYAYNPNDRPQIAGLKQLIESLLISSDARVTDVTNATGQSLVTRGRENNDRRTRIPGSAIAYPLTGTPTSHDPIVLLPGSGSYRITSVGSASGSYQQALVGGGLDMLLSSTTARGEHDQISVAGRSDSVTFATSALTKPFTLDAVAPGGGSRRAIELTSNSFRGGSDQLTVLPGGSAIQYAHVGPATTIDLRLSALSSSGLPVAFDSGPVRVARGEVVRFTPSRWQQLGSVWMSIGSRPRVLLRNRVRRLAAARALRVTVRNRGGRTRTITITATAGRFPAGARLEFVLDVSRDRKPIARRLMSWTGSTLRPGRHSASFTFSVARPGRYLVRAVATVAAQAGVITRAAASSKSLTLTIR
jgi:hypothetical protein